jgi:hypothetical protein
VKIRERKFADKKEFVELPFVRAEYLPAGS